jgi:hypothetical protein
MVRDTAIWVLGSIGVSSFESETFLLNNTIIIPFRNAGQLPLCLTSLEVCEDIDQLAVSLVQHGGKEYEGEHHDLHLSHFYVYDRGSFHLSKLLNAAIKRARTEWVTILHPGILVPADFITKLEDAIANAQRQRCYFPIRYLDSSSTEDVETRFNSFYEAVIPNRDKWKRGSDTHGGYLIGTACFAVRTSRFVELGGYDERFSGGTLADIEFGRRWENAFGVPDCIECDLYHRWHRLGFYNDICANDALETRLFTELERNKFPHPEITENWWVFPQTADG